MQLRQIVVVVVSSRGSNLHITGFNFNGFDRTCQSSTIGAVTPQEHEPFHEGVSENTTLSHCPRQQQRMNFPVAAINSLLVVLRSRVSYFWGQSTWIAWFAKWLGCGKVIRLIIVGMPEYPFLPPFSLSKHSPCCHWVEALALCGLLQIFLQTLQLPSELPCSWNLEWRRWHHRERILQNN